MSRKALADAIKRFSTKAALLPTEKRIQVVNGGATFTWRGLDNPPAPRLTWRRAGAGGALADAPFEIQLLFARFAATALAAEVKKEAERTANSDTSIPAAIAILDAAWDEA